MLWPGGSETLKAMLILNKYLARFAKEQNGIIVVLSWILRIPHKLQVNLFASHTCGLLYNLFIFIWLFLIDWKIQVYCFCGGNNEYINDTVILVSKFEVISVSSMMSPVWNCFHNQHWLQGALEYCLWGYLLIWCHYKCSTIPCLLHSGNKSHLPLPAWLYGCG